MHYMRERALGASAHVHGLRAQPERVDADHRNTSRSTLRSRLLPRPGHVTLTPSAPRLNSRRMSAGHATAAAAAAGAGDGGGNDIAMNWDADSATVVDVANKKDSPRVHGAIGAPSCRNRAKSSGQSHEFQSRRNGHASVLRH
ncbi:MAG: hypothetical protein Q7T87_10330 [Polaromonas sp.]|nr:hypothetical protein [Polaromonas sp.]